MLKNPNMVYLKEHKFVIKFKWIFLFNKPNKFI